MYPYTIFVEMSLEEGLQIVAKGKEVQHYIGTQRISTASGSALFLAQKENLQCVCCGLKANKWIAKNVRHQYPVLDLYGTDEEGNEILFTRDHIIPKVFGGNEHLDNLRVMCSQCNGVRSCNLEHEVLDFYYQNMSRLIKFERITESIQKLESGLTKGSYQVKDAEVVISNFKKIFEYLKMKNAMNVQYQEAYRKFLHLEPLLKDAVKREALRLKK